jgi:CTP synthase
MREKLSMFCNVPVKAVIEELDVQTSIYELPLALQKERMDDLVVRLLGLKARANPRNLWAGIVRRIKSPRHEVKIGVVGKYIELQDAYKSVYEALAHAGIANNCRVRVVRLDAEDFETRRGLAALARHRLDGILVPGGFGDRGIEGKIAAARFARLNRIPYYGLCLGMQVAVIEFARNVLGLRHANSVEFDDKTPHPVIALMDEQRNIVRKGGTMRLGAYECRLKPGTLARRAYGVPSVSERHRHRYEVNNHYLARLEKAGMVISGWNPKRGLVEVAELKHHPWFLGVQCHPEFQSKPNKAHPLFASFIAAAIRYQARRGKK